LLATGHPVHATDLPLPPPQPAGAHHALDQRHRSDSLADERPADLQRTSALYWGKSSYSGKPAILEVPKAFPFGKPSYTGKPATIELANKFPSWMTVPSGQWLAMGRRWHFFFAWAFVINGCVYLAHSIASRHVQRDLKPTREDWRGIWHSIRIHLRLRRPRDEGRGYNVLQKVSYLLLIFGLFPLIVLTGCAMSPWLNSILPGWVDLLGGRQSARTLHFIAAFALVLFVLIHVFEVAVTGFWNNCARW
jgi:thiosulfate reductase cytochrome b subunit